MAEDKPYTPSEKRANLRSPLIVMQAKMGDGRQYFFGYAKNISRAGVFIQTVNPKALGEEFNIEFTLPKTTNPVKCRCKVVWSRKYSASNFSIEPGMGLEFIDIDPLDADTIDSWVRSQP
jgi:uncharacterized protein (TIGR02266 family)